jgi:hypothetical protein
MGVSVVERSKEENETDAKKQRRNCKVAMSSDRRGWSIAARLVVSKTRQIYERDTRAFGRGPSSQNAYNAVTITVDNRLVQGMRGRYISVLTIDHRGFERLYILLSKNGKSHIQFVDRYLGKERC